MMDLTVLRSLLANIKKYSPCRYKIIGDEATDVLNREHFNLWWVSNDYKVHEDPLWLFSIPNRTSVAIHVVTFLYQFVEARLVMVQQTCRQKEWIARFRKRACFPV